MVAVNLTWTAPPSLIVGNLDVWRDRVLAGLHAIADTFAGIIRGWMVANAPWSDRSGEARRGLDALVEKAATSVTIRVFHTVSYGQHLELGTRYMSPRPVIRPAIEAHVAAIAAALRALVA